MDITVLILTVLLAASIALLGVLLRRTGRQGSELAELNSELSSLRADKARPADAAHSLQQLEECDAAGLRRARAGEGRGVQAVQIDGQVHGRALRGEHFHRLCKPLKGKGVHVRVRLCEAELLPLPAADAELVDAPVA